MSIDDVTLNEGNAGTTSFDFTVSLDMPAPAGGVTFDIATADGTTDPATQPSDYTAKSLTSQTIPVGSSTYSFSVRVNGDLDVVPDETFFVNVTNVTGAYLSDGQGQGTIMNDDIPATVTATAATPQSTTVNTAFATNLQAAVKDASNNPLSGVTVTFTAPGSGASGTFAGAVNTAVTNASGIATAAVFTANGTAGSYNVSASVSGVGTPATFSLTNNPASTNVTVTTSPAGLSFTVDATTYSSSQTFNWAPDGNHTIATTSPQNPGAGTQYVFLNWSDAGAISHSITAPSTATTYTANFKTQHQLTTSARAGGSISPASGFYDEGNVVITATTDPGFTFTGFTGALSGTTCNLRYKKATPLNGGALWIRAYPAH